MARVSQTLGSLTDGVSTLPQLQRAPGKANSQSNILSLKDVGQVRRPPTEFLASVLNSSTGYADAFTHEIRMEDGQRYIVVVINGTIQVFDADTGVEADVSSPDGLSYLTTVSRGFRAITIKDQTFLVNCAETVRQGVQTSDAWTNQALLYVRSGDFATTYSVTLAGQTVTYTSDAADRSLIATDVILAGIKALLVANVSINPAFTLTIVGSSLHIMRADGLDFTISASDGLADTALVVITKTVQRFTDLPERAVEGFTVEVVGDDQTKFDNYFVQYTEVDMPDGSGVWKETVEPGTPIGLNAATMPHVLEYAAPLEEFAALGVPAQPALDYTPFAGKPAVRVTYIGTEILPPGYRAYLSGASITTGAVFPVQLLYENTTGANVTGATVLAALEALAVTDPAVNVTHTSANNVRFESTDANSLLFVADLVSGSAYSPGLGLTVDQYVGFTFHNLTDGSTGLITSNTAEVIFCSAGFTGGAYNIVQDGDLCTITDTGVYFVFKKADWSDREVGDSDSSPFPSIVGSKIEDVFDTGGRLWMIAGPNVVASRAGDLLNLFRQTATQILPDDPIDVRDSLRGAPAFHSALNNAGSILLFSEEGQFELVGKPVFSPTTVSLKKVGSYQSNADVHPVILGDVVYFAAVRAGSTVILAGKVRDTAGEERAFTAEDLTVGINGYIAGSALELVGDDSRGLLFLRTDDDRAALYVYAFRFFGEEIAQRAWSKWTYNDVVVGLAVYQGHLSVVSKVTEGLTLLESSLDQATQHLDRLVTNATAVQTIGYITWTLPYSNSAWASPTSIPLSVFRGDTGEELTFEWRSATTIRHYTGITDVNWETIEVCIGIPYRSSYILSTIFTRDQNKEARDRGRLVIQSITVDCDPDTTEDLSAAITVDGRDARTYTYVSGETFDVPVHGQNKSTTIELFTEQLGPFSMSDVAWAGESYPSGKRQ